MNYLLCLASSILSGLTGLYMKEYQKKTRRIKNADHVFNFTLSLIVVAFYAISGALSDGLILLTAF